MHVITCHLAFFSPGSPGLSHVSSERHTFVHLDFLRQLEADIGEHGRDLSRLLFPGRSRRAAPLAPATGPARKAPSAPEEALARQVQIPLGKPWGFVLPVNCYNVSINFT